MPGRCSITELTCWAWWKNKTKWALVKLEMDVCDGCLWGFVLVGMPVFLFGSGLLVIWVKVSGRPDRPQLGRWPWAPNLCASTTQALRLQMWDTTLCWLSDFPFCILVICCFKNCTKGWGYRGLPLSILRFPVYLKKKALASILKNKSETTNLLHLMH